MHKPILVCCDYRDELGHECGRRYYLPYVRMGDSYRMELMMDFTVCPTCGHARNQAKFDRYNNSKKCYDCKVPHELQALYKNQRCIACYLQDYRSRRKMQDIVKVVKVTDIIKA